MALPETSRLRSLAQQDCTRLATRLRDVHVDAEQVSDVVQICERMPSPLPLPMRLWHLRRRRDAFGFALRALMFDDPITEDEAAEALGADLTAKLLDAGLLTARAQGRVASPFRLSLIGNSMLFADDLQQVEDGVMGAGKTTRGLCGAALPTRRVESVLDLGCGAGALAIVLAERAARVVATDVNPRALELARFNAAFNGITNIDFRLGDLFEPVAGEAFDVVVSQPPFIARPPDTRPQTWLHGGERGDELPRRLLSGLLPHLRESGRAVIMVEWPEVDGDPLEQRVVDALGAGAEAARVLLVLAERTRVDEHCTAYAFGLRREPTADFGPTAMLWRDHFERLGVHALQLTLNVVERAQPAWRSSIEVRPLGAGQLASGHVDRFVASRSLLFAGHEAILASTLRVPEGVSFLEVGSGRVRVTFPDVLEPIEITKAAAALVASVHEAPTVRDAVDALAPSLGGALPEAREKALDGVRKAVSFGVLSRL
jgi:SAM-dependent methyltransferase